MFRSRDRGRTHFHNVRLAALLSTVAGVVNIVGLLSFHTLTTNVTGHFAFFSQRLFFENYRLAWISILFVIFFFVGAFIANTAMELMTKQTIHLSYKLPISLEIVFLTAVAVITHFFDNISVLPACILLLAMGLQNALVTKISGSVVRTTHLTGLFTDMGIELSQMMFYKKNKERYRLRRSIFLRLIIIGGFFAGGILGASLHSTYKAWTLLVPIALLFVALYYDRMRLNYLQIRRKIRKRALPRERRRTLNGRYK